MYTLIKTVSNDQYSALSNQCENRASFKHIYIYIYTYIKRSEKYLYLYILISQIKNLLLFTT